MASSAIACMASPSITSKRSANFSPQEESLLVSMAQKHKKVLECKLTDMTAHEENRKAWGKIEQEFNSMSGQTYRAQDVLRRKYDNIKKKVKKKYSDEKCYSLGTGGGPPRNTTFTDLDSTIKEILGTTIEGSESKFDDDAESTPIAEENIFVDEDLTFSVPQQYKVVSQHQMTLQQEEEYILRDESESLLEDQLVSTNIPTTSTDITGNDTSNINNWSHYTPKMLKNKKSQELKIKKSTDKQTNTISDRVSQWAEARCQLQQSNSYFADKQNELKLKFMQEKHDKEISLMQDKHDREMCIMESIMEREAELKRKLMVEKNEAEISMIKKPKF